MLRPVTVYLGLKSTNLFVTVHGGNTKRPHKSESNGKGVFKLHEMYTNRAYESEMDSRNGHSGHSNSGDPTPSPPQPESASHRKPRHSKTNNRQI